MSDITPFRFPPTGDEVRTIKINGDAWFVAVDVATVLGYANPRDAVATHVDSEDRSTVALTDGARGGPDRTIINESGLYALIFGSRLAAAKEFKRWVTSEVLPSLRRTGQYVMPARTGKHHDLDMIRNMADAIEADRARLDAIEDRQAVVESHLGDVLGNLGEFSAMGYARKHELPTDRPFLIRLGKRATALMAESGEQPRKRDDISFGRINVYPVAYLDKAAQMLM